ncbi:DUF6702 family protein [Fibrisoma limi]|uniref:DUF6702 family protein n=1 Tax=Fibrisoma limi TaxID=663275 RepID=UPI001E5AFFD4|nr:DUF6702 family protein [Fibrisoma limi]
MAGCLLGARPLRLHDFHASVTQMQFNPKEKAFEISIRLFTDDLETALAKESGQKIHLSANDKFDPLIEKYVRAHFAYVTSDRQRKPTEYVGYELEADACWVYLQMPYAEAFQGGQMKQDILMELFDDQVNMVNIQYSGQKKTFVFRKNQPIQPISL